MITSADITDDDIRDLHERCEATGDRVGTHTCMLAFTGAPGYRERAREGCAAMIQQWLEAAS
jgi:hypothetical protein